MPSRMLSATLTCGRALMDAPAITHPRAGGARPRPGSRHAERWAIPIRPVRPPCVSGRFATDDQRRRSPRRRTDPRARIGTLSADRYEHPKPVTSEFRSEPSSRQRGETTVRHTANTRPLLPWRSGPQGPRGGHHGRQSRRLVSETAGRRHRAWLAIRVRASRTGSRQPSRARHANCPRRRVVRASSLPSPVLVPRPDCRHCRTQ